MHGYVVHEALYQTCEIHVFWVRYSGLWPEPIGPYTGSENIFVQTV